MLSYEQIINLGLQKGLEEIELYSRNSESNTIQLFEGKLSKNNSKNIFGMSIRGLYNGKMAYVYTESLEEDVINKLLDDLIENAKTINNDEEEHVFPGGSKYQECKELKADFDNYHIQDKINLLKGLDHDILAADNRIIKVGYNQYSENRSETRIMNSKGLNLSRSESYCSCVAEAVANDGKNTTLGFESDISAEFKKLNTKKIVKNCVEQAVSSLGAGNVNSGEYKVVFNKNTASALLSAFSEIFDGESALRKVTTLTDKVDKQVFGQNINIIDDPFWDKAIAQIPFDDEGVPCKTKFVVENGVFKGFLHSLKTAKFFNQAPTGNGFKPGTSASVSTMPTNMYLAPGNLTEEELFAKADNGIFITEVNGLHAGLNPISGDFNIQSRGFMIKNGKKAEAVTLFVISGNFFEMLNNVIDIANNIDNNVSGVVSPSILINKLMVSGK